MSNELRQALEKVARRYRRLRLWGGLALCWAAWALVGLGLVALGSRAGGRGWIEGPWLPSTFAAAAVATGLLWAWRASRSARDPRWVARRIEARHPDLGTGLLAAVEQRAADPDGRLGYLQSAVVGQALDHGLAHDWEETVPTWSLRGVVLAHAAALALLAVVSVALVGQARAARAAGRAGARPVAAGAFDIKVEPGNAEVERGSPLLVVARFGKGVPADAHLVVEGGTSGSASTSPPSPSTKARRVMTRSLDDPTFAGRIDSVDADLTYRVEFDGRSTPPYRIRVFEYPELERTDARLVFPQYTSLEPRTVEDVRHVTAVEGTELTLLFRLNKDVARARLVDEQGKALALEPRDEDGPHAYRATVTLSDPRRYRVQLVDRDGRPNKLPAELVVNVTRNRPPVVKMTQPSRDVRVSPVEELRLKADASDDFGVVRHGLSYTMAGQEPREIVLPDPEPAKPKEKEAKAKGRPDRTPKPAGPPRQVKAEHLIDFEALRSVPDQLVTYFFWAEDVGPDGKPRRSAGDMFFAEVRPFEEIFRQGEQPAESAENENEGEQQGNAREAEKLAELQKEIINATWKLVRREAGAKPSDKFAEDAKTVRESQQSAIEQAGPMGGRLRDAKSKASLEQAVRAMKEAEKQLARAAETPAVAPMTPALASEQAAYQALLKLRAREFEVVRGNRRQRSQSGRNSSGSPSDRQLQQLELSNEENRYEDQRSARARQEQSSKQEQEQRETRQVVNRLRELAQRQGDLNQRLKELQSSLEAAKTPESREEIERQLKRLRDQQEQILRDTDELRERMEREENRDRMAEARQQIEQGREHVRQASEALEQGRLSQALTEGSRAGKQLNDLREELRKEASNKFSEGMTEMRDQARRLDEDQKKLSDQLDAWNRRPERSLRDNEGRREARQGLEQQSKRLDQLLDRMKRTVEEAEETEPLLARELFDTARRANEQAIPDALKNAEQLTDLGVAEEAVKSSRRAGQGLEQLREGVDRAARSVLGDDTAALQRARGELDDLADQLNREIARATGQPPTPDGRGTPRPQAQRGPNGRQPSGQPGEQAQQGQQDGQRGEQGQDGQQGQGGQQDQQGQRGSQGGRQGQRGRQGSQGDREGQQTIDPFDATEMLGGQRNPQGQQGQQGEQGQGGQQVQQGGQQQGQDGQGGQQGQQGGQQQGQGGQQGQQGGQQGQQGERGQQGGQGGQQGGQGRRGQGPLRDGDTQPQDDGEQPGRGQPQNGRQAGARQGGGGGGGGAERGGALERMLDGLARGSGPGGPVTGEGFREWSDRMRDVEELLDDPQWRAEAARIRDRVRGAREDFRRHAKAPDWNQLKSLVAEPIGELRARIDEELRRRESPDALVPIDRDPVPPQFAEGVRRYYERLGSGR